ncbi:MAG: RNA polymerase sigma factor [Bacteroidota bacterium]
MKNHLDKSIQAAIAGDKKSLELILDGIKDLVYNLSLKMLLFPEDAEDASQEILIRILTRLSTFKSESSFKTWVYRVASNYLISYKGKFSQSFAMSLEEYGDFIDQGQKSGTKYAQNAGEMALLEEEVKVSCTQGILMCLNKQSRLIYILGDIFEFNSQEGAEILGIKAENFRQGLARSRKKVRNFLENKCGLANPKNPCRCSRKIDFLIDQGLIEPTKLRFAPISQRSIEMVKKLEQVERVVEMHRSNPNFPSPESLRIKINSIL